MSYGEEDRGGLYIYCCKEHFPVLFSKLLCITQWTVFLLEHCELMAPPLRTNGYVSSTGARKHVHINRHAHVLYTHLPVRDERGE